MSHDVSSLDRGQSKEPLSVHGFVLAGGRSSRMGRDKALLPFRGRSMVEIAVEKLRSFCSAVSIAGNREDLSGFAPVVRETRLDCGPAAGIEAGLQACTQPWALFLPVDVPLVPRAFLQLWAEAVLDTAECRASYLVAGGHEQPAFCMWRQECFPLLSEAVAQGERRVRNLLWATEATGGLLWVCHAEEIGEALLDKSFPALQLSNWFLNVNTPDEFLEAEIAIGAE